MTDGLHHTHTFQIDKSTTSAQVLILHIDCRNQLLGIFPFAITVECKIKNMIILKRKEFSRHAQRRHNSKPILYESKPQLITSISRLHNASNVV